MSHLPSVSVVVPVFNEEKSIQACIDSLLNQKYDAARVEIIVVDNGSTDRSTKILAGFGQKLNLLHEDRRGPAAARNSGIAAATGEVIAFTDADCVASKDWLTELIPPLSEPGVGLVCGKILALPPATEIEQFSEILDDHEASVKGRLPTAITMNWASRTADIRAVGAFDPEFLQGEDSDLSLRMHLAGHSFRYQPSAIVYHRNEETFARLFHEGYRQGMAFVRLARKHRETYRKIGVPRVHLRGYLDLALDLLAAVGGSRRATSFCSVCFNAGKTAGKMAGSLRYRHLRL